jgi:hypothetical protein
MASATTSACADIYSMDLTTVCGDVKSLLVPNTLDEWIVQNKQEAIAVSRLSPIELSRGKKRLF